jgi:hypothetical protein
MQKCDGEQPSCSNCIRSQIRCEYVPVPQDPEPTSNILNQIHNLQSRVDDLEAMLETMNTQASST